jgi:hypothetical protein
MYGNRISRYLGGSSIRRGYDGEEFIPQAAIDDPTFVWRLSMMISRPSAQWRANLPASIKQTPPNVSFFVDSNVWDINIEADLWHALLERSDSVFVIPSVRLEIDGWINRNPDYIGSRAVRENHSNLIMHALPATGSDEATAYLYYIYLLQLRRRIFDIIKFDFHRKKGRDPGADELMTMVQKTFGERGLLLAHKDGKPAPLDKWATDESLVYFAFEHALRTGKPTVILTKDEDVLEQFYKMWWFTDTHYRASLIADFLADNRFAFPLHAFPSSEYAQGMFDLRNAVLVDIGPRRMSAFLPRNFNFVPIECWLIRREMMRMILGAETQMYRVLRIKGATGGFVSDKLEGRNLHPWLAPLPIADRLRTCAAIVYDRTRTLTDNRAKVGMFDATHAVNTHERFSRLVTDPRLSKTGLWTPRDSLNPLASRLWTPQRRTEPQTRMGLWKPRDRE